MLRSVLDWFKSGSRRSKSRRQVATRSATTRLSLETLEDRLVPSGGIGPGAIIALGLPDPAAAKAAAQSAAPSRPISGHGAGNFTSANFDFFATGIALHLGAFTHYGTLVLTPTDDPAVFRITGHTTYEAANGDKLFASLEGTLNLATGVGTGVDTWEGGTGRFANATGTADLVATLLPGGAFEFTLKGVILY
jgi:hypothetical protein